MKTLLFFAFRNILRQKRRAVLLGTAMALGTCFLVLAGSFVAGITQTLFDRVLVYVAGHASVIVCDRGYTFRTALRNEIGIKSRIEKLPHVKRVSETMGIMCRLVGTAKADNGILISVDLSQKQSKEEMDQTRDNFPMVSGSFGDLGRRDVDVPAILAKPKADYLGLKTGDQFAVRFQDSRGRRQVSHLTLVGVFQPSNSFMEAPLFVPLDRMKAMMDMDSSDLPYLYLTLDNPQKYATAIGDSLRKIFQSRDAALPATVGKGKLVATGTACGIKTDSVSRARMDKSLSLVRPWKPGKVVLPAAMAASLHVAPGDTVKIGSGFSRIGDPMTDDAEVAGTWAPPPGAENVVLWDEDAFQAARSFRKGKPGDSGQAQVAAASKVLDTLISPEWTVLPAARTTDAVKDQARQIGARSWKSPVVAVRTMYETGEQILKLAAALNVITLVAVLVLFLVILTGVVNTLRMTVRERTREIGTLRSLGMQAGQVMQLFLMETGLLALFSAFAGTALAGLAMFGLSRLAFGIEGNPLSILLVRGHLVFVPSLLHILIDILLVVGMAVLAAWRPAAVAARLSPATALRHHE